MQIRSSFTSRFSLTDLVDSHLRSLNGDTGIHSLHTCSELIRAQHLGAQVPTEQLREGVCKAVDTTIDYFSAGRISVDGWFKQLSGCIFLCSFCGEAERLQQACEWATPRKKPEYQGILDDEIQILHLVLASLFQAKPAAGFRRLLAKCRESSKTRIRLLANMVDAIDRDDQPAFEQAARRAVKNYRKRRLPDPSLALLTEMAASAHKLSLSCGFCGTACATRASRFRRQRICASRFLNCGLMVKGKMGTTFRHGVL